MNLLKKSLLVNMAISILMASLFIFLSRQGFLQRIELASTDFQFHIRGSIPYNHDICIIEITNTDISEVGRWPWKRSWDAAIAKVLKELGARSVYFDILFSEPSSDEEDALLEQAIKLTEKVYLPFAFEGTTLDNSVMVFPLKRFAPYLKGTGAINIYPDVDGTLRKIPLILYKDKEAYPHVALRIAMDYSSSKIKGVKKDCVILTDGKEEMRIPTFGKNNSMLINWCGKWQKTFRHYDFLDVLTSYKDMLDGKKPKIDLNDFKDSICLIGITAVGLYDIRSIPLQPEYPGIGVMATAVSNILDRRFIHEAPFWANILILYILTLIPAFFIFGERPLREMLDVFGIAFIYLIINYMAFRNGTQLPLFTHLLGLFSTHLMIGIYNFVRIAVERQRFFKMSVTDGLTGLYNIRYFRMLLESEVMFAKVDPQKKFSIIMGDIDHFKHFNDEYGHQVGDLVLKEVASVLKSSVRSLDIVARYGGEELIILLRGTSLKDGLTIAEKIRKNIENSAARQGDTMYKITISLGVASFTREDTVDSIIKRSDDGLYRSKEGGRNRVSSIETP